MKTKLLIAIIVSVVAIPIAYLLQPYYYTTVHRLTTKSYAFTYAGFTRNLLYRLFKPGMKNAQKYPLVLVLHSAFERGNDNFIQIDAISSTFMSLRVQQKHPCFVVIPQCPKGTQWVNTGFKKTPFSHYQQASVPESEEMRMIIEVLHQLIAQYPIDTSRIYVTGFSMGGSGTWDIISRHPDIFAAAIAMSGVSDTSTAGKIQHIPVWAFHGKLDDIAPARLNIEMCDAVKKAGGNCRLTVYEDVGHYCVNRALKEHGLFKWLFLHYKK